METYECPVGIHMNNTQSELVEKTFPLIRPNAELAANVLYTRLFEISPQFAPCK